MSDSLSPKARALVNAARRSDHPSDADRARLRRAIAGKVAGGAIAAVAVATSAKAAASAAGASSTAAAGFTFGIGTKVLLSAALVGMVGMGATTYLQATHDAPAITAPSAIASSHTAIARKAPAMAAPKAKGAPSPMQSAEPAPDAEPEAARGESAAPPVPTAGVDPLLPSTPEHRAQPKLEPRSVRHDATPSAPAASAGSAYAAASLSPAAATPEAPPPVNAVADEVLMLREAHAALTSGDPGRALSLLDEHARRFPRGALGEEREATRVLALCAAGRIPAARSAGETFLRVFPRSFHAARVRASCAGPF